VIWSHFLAFPHPVVGFTLAKELQPRFERLNCTGIALRLGDI